MHGVHCPHDSTARKRDTPAASAAKSVSSSNTMNAPQPSPDPAAAIASYVSGVSRSAAGTRAFETPLSTAVML